MADIISFHAAARRFQKPVPVAPVAAGPAQVLFFTGVRYERRDAPAAKKPRKRKTAIVSVDAATAS